MRDVPPPNGVQVLAVAHIVAGGLGALGGAVIGVLGPLTGFVRGGVPAVWLGAIALFLLAGVGLGAALWRGRTWAWWLASTAYLVGFMLGCAAVVRWIGTPTAVPFRGWMSLKDAVLGLAAVGAATVVLLAGLPVSAYLSRRPVREYFGTGDRPWWVPFAGQVALGAALVAGLTVYGIREDTERHLVRLHQIGGAGGMGGEADEPYLIERLERGNADERAAAAWAIGQARSAGAFEALLRAAREDPEATVRLNAVESLAAFGDERSEPALREWLSDPDEQIQAAALRGLAGERFAGSVDAVGAVLVDGPERLHALAADALGRMRTEAAIPFLERAARDPDPDVRSRVAFALGKLRSRAAVPTLVGMLDDESWEVRANAAQAAGWIGDASARPGLLALLDDPDPRVRRVARAALEELP